MCKLCNDTLLAAASAANQLAEAAEKLYDINMHAQAKTLADAAADLFKPAAEEQASPGSSGEAGKSEGIDPEAAARAEINSLLPEGMELGADGKLYLNDKSIGEAVIIRRPTKQ